MADASTVMTGHLPCSRGYADSPQDGQSAWRTGSIEHRQSTSWAYLHPQLSATKHMIRDDVSEKLVWKGHSIKTNYACVFLWHLIKQAQCLLFQVLQHAAVHIETWINYIPVKLIIIVKESEQNRGGKDERRRLTSMCPLFNSMNKSKGNVYGLGNP